jgi:hypothetical protein
VTPDVSRRRARKVERGGTQSHRREVRGLLRANDFSRNTLIDAAFARRVRREGAGGSCREPARESSRRVLRRNPRSLAYFRRRARAPPPSSGRVSLGVSFLVVRSTSNGIPLPKAAERARPRPGNARATIRRSPRPPPSIPRSSRRRSASRDPARIEGASRVVDTSPCPAAFAGIHPAPGRVCATSKAVSRILAPPPAI